MARQRDCPQAIYNSDQYVIWETLASILIEQGKFDEAEKALETSLSLDEAICQQ